MPAAPLGRLVRRCTDEIAVYLEKEDAFTALRALYGLEKEISDGPEIAFFTPRPFLLGEMELCLLLRKAGRAGVLPPGFRQYLEDRERFLSPGPDTL